jgi:hypothetical protein
MLLATQWQSMFGLQGLFTKPGAISIVVQRVIVIGDEPYPSPNRSASCESLVQHLPSGSLKEALGHGSELQWCGLSFQECLSSRRALIQRDLLV